MLVESVFTSSCPRSFFKVPRSPSCVPIDMHSFRGQVVSRGFFVRGERASDKFRHAKINDLQTAALINHQIERRRAKRDVQPKACSLPSKYSTVACSQRASRANSFVKNAGGPSRTHPMAGARSASGHRVVEAAREARRHSANTHPEARAIPHQLSPAPGACQGTSNDCHDLFPSALAPLALHCAKSAEVAEILGLSHHVRWL